MRLRIQWIVTLLLLTLPLAGQAADYTYTTNSDGTTITITRYTGNSGGGVTIPETIDSYPVTSIASYAFAGTTLTSVSIPNSVASIGGNAFWICRSLTDVSIGNNVTNIGNKAFDECNSLTNVMIGNSVTSIGDGAFADCTSLACVIIPDSVTSINLGAFSGCAALTNITFGSNVTSIGKNAFLGTSLTSVSVGSSVTNIGMNAFDSCFKLTAISVDALNSFYSSTDGVLFNQGRTTLIRCPQGKAGSYTVPSGVTSIGTNAFYRCLTLTNVTISDDVTSIGMNAFDTCNLLTNVTIGISVTNIDSYAFISCYHLAGVYFKGNAPTLGSIVFGGDFSATPYYLPGTTNWGVWFESLLTKLWQPHIQTTDGALGVQTNQFAFNIAWASGMNIAVDACTNLVNPNWVPLQTNTLSADTFYFSDPDWTNSPRRFYRVRWPGPSTP